MDGDRGVHAFAMMLKTYAGDSVYAHRLAATFEAHNVDGIPLYIVAPANDLPLFEDITCATELVAEERLGEHLVTEPLNGVRPGYINQEIVKLAFWELGLTANYLCLDSDGEFIRDFRIADFMFDETTPYTLLAEDNDLIVDPFYYRTYWEARRASIAKIQRAVGLSDRTMITSHGFSIFSAKVLGALREKYMVPNGLDYRGLLNISPYEFSWYNMWLQSDRTIPIHPREPLFKYLHHKGQHLAYLDQNIHLEDIARGYVGIVVNSNYSRGFGLVSFDAGDVYDPTLADVMGHFSKALSQTARLAWRLPARVSSRLTGKRRGI
jgi:hypothetical protein